MSQHEVINALVDGMDNLRSKDQNFAKSLIMGFNKWGSLTERQFPHAMRLAVVARDGYTQREAAPTTNLGDFGEVFGLMQGAAANLKFPKIRLHTEDGKPVVLGIAGPRSKYAGQIQITDGGPYGSNRYYGRIDGQGNWTRGRDAESGVEAILRRLGDDPAGTAADYGKLTGSCCFCSKHLEDERSTDQGYGPVCAKNFNLPWGNKS